MDVKWKIIIIIVAIILVVGGFFIFSYDAKQNSCEGLNYTAKLTGCYEDKICFSGGTFAAEISFDNQNPNVLFKDVKIGVKNPNIEIDSALGAINTVGQWEIIQGISYNSTNAPVTLKFNSKPQMQEELDSLFEVHYFCQAENYSTEATSKIIFNKNYSFRKPNIEMHIKRAENPLFSSPKETQFIEIKNIDRVNNLKYRLEISTNREMQIIGEINGIAIQRLDEDQQTGHKRYLVDNFFLDPNENGFLPLRISLERGYTEQARNITAKLYYYVNDTPNLLIPDSQLITLATNE